MAFLRLFKLIYSNKATTVWTLSGSVAVLTLFALTAYLAGSVAPVAFAAEARMAGLQNTSVDEFVDGNPALIGNLQVQIDQTRAELEFPARFANGVRNFAPAVAWIPPLKQEISTIAGQVERAKNDLDTASSVISSSSQLLSIYGNAEQALLTPGANSAIGHLKIQAEDAEQTFSESINAMSSARLASDTGSLILQAPRVRGLNESLCQLEEELLAASSVGYEVSGLMIELLKVAEALQPLLTQFASEESVPTSLESTRASLERAIEHAESAEQKAESVREIVSDTGYGSQFLPKLETLNKVLEALKSASRGAIFSLDAVGPALNSITDSNEGFLSSGKLIDVFDSVLAHRVEIEGAVADLAKAERTLNEVASDDRGTSSTGLARVSQMVSEIREGLDLINNFAPVASDILAEGDTRKYMVLGQSADEIRATGGFVSSIWLVTFEDGGLADIQYFDTVRVDDWDRLEFYPTAPVGLEEHMNGWVWLLRDVSWDPDFPTTARSAEDIFRLGQRQQVDGVIAINQWTFLKLVDALGEIPSPDGGDAISSRNLLSVLEQGTDVYGRAYMDLIMRGALGQLDEDISMPKLMGMASSLLDTLETNDTMLFMNSTEVQNSIRRMGWDGGIPDDNSDYLFVVDSNVGWSKVDRNIQRDVNYTIDLSRNSNPRGTLSLVYNNHSGPGSPPCEPQWLSRGTDYSQLKNACYWNYLRVYIPQESRLLSSTELPLPVESVSVEIGKGVPGQETGSISSSHGKMFFSGIATFEAGERKEISLVYDLPKSIVHQEDNQLVYELFIQKQSGIRERDVNVNVIPPQGYTFSKSSLEPIDDDTSQINYAIDLSQNTHLTVIFVRDSDVFQ